MSTETTITEIQESTIKGVAKKLGINTDERDYNVMLGKIKEIDKDKFNTLTHFIKTYEEYLPLHYEQNELHKTYSVTPEENQKLQNLKNLVYKLRDDLGF